jgi:hypothetical protein
MPIRKVVAIRPLSLRERVRVRGGVMDASNTISLTPALSRKEREPFWTAYRGSGREFVEDG